ncbi:MAG: DUF2799 domain-containing protein [Inhella sp.]
MSRGLLALALLGALLGGCAVMDAEDCAVADWRQLGRQDAGDGYLLDRLDERAKACRKHGHGADRDAYQAGHRAGQRDYCSGRRGRDDAAAGRKPAKLCLLPPQAEYEAGFDAGLLHFCSPRGAYEHGRLGGDDPRTCSGGRRSGFESGYRLGRAVHETESKRKQLDSEASRQRARADDSKLKPDEREQAKRRAEELAREIDGLRKQQRRLELQSLLLPN